MLNNLAPWIVFHIFIIFMLLLDLGVFHKKSHEISIKESIVWSCVWVTLALLFNVGVYYIKGHNAALEFLTGYLLEESLSVDNIFVMVMLLSYFSVPKNYQHKVLFYGIIGAILMRGTLIIAGISLIKHFHWIMYIFGVFLIYTGIKMVFADEDAEVHPEKNIFIKIVKKFYPVTHEFHKDKFFVKINNVKHATPLFMALIVIEVTDLIFAFDSIPAIFAITNDPFVVYTSNIFAILGLRSLYFALSGIIGIFHYLKYGLSVVLTFVGVKMVIADLYKIPIFVSLITILGILGMSVFASILWPNKKKHSQEE